MTVSPGDVLKVTIEFSLSTGTICQNVAYFRSVLTGGVTDAATVSAIKSWADAAYQEIDADFENGMTANTSYVDTIEWDSVGSKWEVVYNVGSFVPVIVPASASELLPQPVSPFIVFNTTRPKSKGRRFLFGYTEPSTSGSVLTAGDVTRLVDFADECLDNAVIDVLNYFVPGIPRVAANLFLDFTSAVVTNIVGTQRRRRPGVGI